MARALTTLEAAEQLPDLVDKACRQGESFKIVENGQEVARLTPPLERPKAITLGEFLKKVEALRTGDPTFADDLENIQAEQPPMGASPWDS